MPGSCRRDGLPCGHAGNRRSLGAKGLGLAVALCVVVTPALCAGGYRIHLKNDRSFVVSDCWREGSELKMHWRGGVVGLPREFVTKVEEEDYSYVPYRPAPAPQATAAAVESATSDTAETEERQTEEPAEKVEKKYLKEYEGLVERFRAVNTMTNDELYAFAKDLVLFKDKVLNNREGHLYSEELLAVYEMGEEVEKTLKARGVE